MSYPQRGVHVGYERASSGTSGNCVPAGYAGPVEQGESLCRGERSEHPIAIVATTAISGKTSPKGQLGRILVA